MTPEALRDFLGTLNFRFRAVDSHRLRSDYTEDNDRNRQLIVDGRVFFASPSSFNDPFECDPPMIFSKGAIMSPREIRQMVDKRAPHLNHTQRRERSRQFERKQHFPETNQTLQLVLTEGIRQTIQEVSVLCLSARYDSILQWSHYAGSHTGFAVGLDPTVDWRHIVTVSDKTLPVTLKAMDVHYQSARPRLDLDFQARTKEEQDEQMKIIFLTKHLDWKYEQERRIVLLNSKPALHKLPTRMLRAVILGAQMSNEDESLITNHVEFARKLQPVTLIRAKLSNTDYGLEFGYVSG